MDPRGQAALRAMYPECDGKRLSESMPQARWIFLLYGNLCAMCSRRDAFVAADNLWYPVEGRPDLRQGSDVYVAFGRPTGDRGSYMQWLEGGIPLTVVFEILSPVSTAEEMDAKFAFYRRTRCRGVLHLRPAPQHSPNIHAPFDETLSQ